MTHEKFQELNTIEKNEFIGQLCHLVQTNEEMFNLAETMIRIGERQGLLDGITILPNTKKQDNENS